MKKLTFITTLLLVAFYAKAQTSAFYINVNTPTNADTLIMPLNGVISAPLSPPASPYSDIIAQLQDIGVKWIRNNDNYDDKLDMEAMFRCTYADTVPSWNGSPLDDMNFHFAESDVLYSAIKDNNFKLFFRLGGEQNSALSHQLHVFQGPQDTIAENNLIQAMVKVVEHYDNFEGESNQLEYLDLWTEWVNTHFWERSQDEFIWFYTKAIDTLNTHFPDKKTGGPGFLHETEKVIAGNATLANAAVRFLSSLYEHDVTIDFIGWHLWNIDPEYYYIAGEQFKDLLDATGDFAVLPWHGTGFFRNTEIICDAWGRPRKYNDGTTIPGNILNLYHNHENGSALFTADWIAMQQTNTTMAFYYRAADVESYPDPTAELNGWTGLFYGNADVTYKPSAFAFKLWGKFQEEFPQKMANEFPVVNSDSEKLWVLSAKNEQGAYGIMVANTDDLSKNFSFNILGVPLNPSDYDILYTKVNDTDNGETVYTVFSNSFSIAPQTVEFIRLLPDDYLASDTENRQNIKFYPNPSKDFIYIENVNNCKINIFDLMGTKIKSNNASRDKAKINLADQVSGIYILQVEKNGEIICTEKIVNLK